MKVLKKDDQSLNLNDKNYLSILEEAKQRIVSTRISAARSILKEQFQLYWWLGEKICHAQEKFDWGNSVVEQLANDLKKAFPASKYGFSGRNLWEMRRFYLEYKNEPFLQQLVAEIPWGQNLIILNKVKDLRAREYYLRNIKEQGWTRTVLIKQIETQAFERNLLQPKQHTFHSTLPKNLALQAEKTFKDIYMLDTLGLTDTVLESEIESRMVHKIKNVMLELGYGFTFIGNQYKVSVEGNDYFIDLLFYNRKLQALVAMELKKGKFQPEYAGKMNFYLNLLDDFVKEPHENASIGIILCSDKNNIVVEYSLRGINKPVGVSKYHLSKNLPEDLRKKLPNPNELEEQILKELAE